MLAETDVFTLHLTSQPIMAVDDHASVKRQIGTQAQEHRAEVGVLKIEVVLIDETMAEFQVVTTALGRIADGYAGAFPTLEDDGDAGLAVQAPVKRFHPFVSANILGWLDHGNALFGGHGFDHGVVLLGNRLQISPRNGLHSTVFVQKPDQHGGALPSRHNDVKDNAIKAGVDETDPLGVMSHKAVHDGLRVLIIEDAVGFICDYQVVGKGVLDQDLVVPVMKKLQKRFGGNIKRASFDRSFHTPENQRNLAEIVRTPCIAWKGQEKGRKQQKEGT